MSELGRMFPDADWAIQADIDGSKDDRRYVRELGFVPGQGFLPLIRSSGARVVVSVRLHGALMAILNGWPAIHLSYSRKGLAAYEDLGLSRFVHDARDFDVELVRDQVTALTSDPDLQWSAIAATRPKLIDHSEHLTHLMAEIVSDL
jgi:hypothetical protein